MAESPQTLRSLADRVELQLLPQLLPWFNLSVLLIPVVLGVGALTRSAANLVSATAPTDIAELETPTGGRGRSEGATVGGSANAPGSPTHPAPAPRGRQPDPGPAPERSPLTPDPLLGYGI